MQRILLAKPSHQPAAAKAKPRTRRSWTMAEKRKIVAEYYARDATPAKRRRLLKKHRINAAAMSRWRRSSAKTRELRQRQRSVLEAQIIKNANANTDAGTRAGTRAPKKPTKASESALVASLAEALVTHAPDIVLDALKRRMK